MIRRLSPRLPVGPDCVLYMPMDGMMSSTKITDLSQYKNHGSIVGATGGLPVMSWPGMTFDGVDDSVKSSDHTSIQNVFDNGGTIEAWIYPKSDGQSGVGRLVDKIKCVILFTNQVAGKVRLYLDRTFSTQYGEWRTTNNEININEWSHVALVYNSSSSSNDPTIYINGVSVSVQEIVTPNGTRTSDAGDDLYIGNTVNANRTFDGFIDEVRIYNRALSALEVKCHYEFMRWKFGV